jgi:hypothetical protein
MTPTSFTFSVTIPGDPRLVGAVKLLAVQAANYAQLGPDVAATLGRVVEREAGAAIATGCDGQAPIDLRFSRDERTITVEISCQAPPSAAPPRSSSSADGVSVAWNADGSRHTCRIRRTTLA